ncbi:MAG: hypothetical protein HOQ43_07595, partial [Glycomyces artemisiae]|nr:hypothetical protein [Glycomyces artemisiae]
MKTRSASARSAGIATLALASLLVGASPALAETSAVVEVGADGTVAADPSFDGPQITEVRVINEGKFLEVYWDRYVDEEAVVSPDNLTLTNGGNEIALKAKPAAGTTDTIFFD